MHVSRLWTSNDLKKLKFGVQAGTTSQNYVMNKLKPSVDPLVFNGSADVVQALKGGQVDAIVVDLPTAFNVIATQVDNGTVVGQFTANEDGNSFGLLLPKGSALTPAVTKAVSEEVAGRRRIRSDLRAVILLLRLGGLPKPENFHLSFR